MAEGRNGGALTARAVTGRLSGIPSRPEGRPGRHRHDNSHPPPPALDPRRRRGLDHRRPRGPGPALQPRPDPLRRSRRVAGRLRGAAAGAGAADPAARHPDPGGGESDGRGGRLHRRGAGRPGRHRPGPELRAGRRHRPPGPRPRPLRGLDPRRHRARRRGPRQGELGDQPRAPRPEAERHRVLSRRLRAPRADHRPAGRQEPHRLPHRARRPAPHPHRRGRGRVAAPRRARVPLGPGGRLVVGDLPRVRRPLLRGHRRGVPGPGRGDRGRHLRPQLRLLPPRAGPRRRLAASRGHAPEVPRRPVRLPRGGHRLLPRRRLLHARAVPRRRQGDLRAGHEDDDLRHHPGAEELRRHPGLGRLRRRHLQARALPEQPRARLRRPLRLQPARLLGDRGVLGHRGPRSPVGAQRAAQRRRRRLRPAGRGGHRQRHHGLRRPRPGGPLPGGGQGLRHHRPAADPGRGPRARERAARLHQVGGRLRAGVLLRPRHPPLAGGRPLRGPRRGGGSPAGRGRACGPWRARPPAPAAGSAPSTSGTAPRSSTSARSPAGRATRRAMPSPSSTPPAIRRASCGWASRSI